MCWARLHCCGYRQHSSGLCGNVEVKKSGSCNLFDPGRPYEQNNKLVAKIVLDDFHASYMFSCGSSNETFVGYIFGVPYLDFMFSGQARRASSENEGAGSNS